MRVSEGTVIVTGASRGIGRATAEAIVARGGRVVAIARDRARLSSLAANHHDQVYPLVADLARLDLVKEQVDEAVGAYGEVHGLVNNAGVLHYQEVGGITLSALRASLEVNLCAPIFWMQALAPRFRQGGGGAIVNVSSSTALRAVPGMATYSASKSALNAATRTFARALAPDGIRVNAVVPAVVDTDMARRPRVSHKEGSLSSEELDLGTQQQIEALREQHPLGRLGTPEDVADVIVGLLDHPWQTGSLVLVDGGLTLHG